MRAVKSAAVAALILAAIPWTPARAGIGWSIGLNFPAPYCYHPYYYHPYPYYYRPYPVYVAAPAVVYQPAPVVQPAYASPLESAPPPLAPVQAVEPSQDGAEQQLKLLNSPDDHVRADAAVQLGRLKVQRAVQPLTQLLSGDRSATVREAAARALGLTDSPAALTALQRAAQSDDDREVRHSAQFAAEGIRANLQH